MAGRRLWRGRAPLLGARSWRAGSFRARPGPVPAACGGRPGLADRVVALSPDLVESIAFGVKHEGLVCGHYWRRLETRLEEEVRRTLPPGARLAGFDLDPVPHGHGMEVRLFYTAAGPRTQRERSGAEEP